MKYRIDVGHPAAMVALALCECGWRGLATSRDAALERLACHETSSHPDEHNVRRALTKSRFRGNRKMSTPARKI